MLLLPPLPWHRCYTVKPTVFEPLLHRSGNRLQPTRASLLRQTVRGGRRRVPDIRQLPTVQRRRFEDRAMRRDCRVALRGEDQGFEGEKEETVKKGDVMVTQPSVGGLQLTPGTCTLEPMWPRTESGAWCACQLMWPWTA